MAENQNVLLSVKNIDVKFRVRGRVLTAIRNISLDVYEGESIAIVGESGSGKSVFTKTFAGMLDENGYISNGDIIFNDAELAETNVNKGKITSAFISLANKSLDKSARLALGAKTYAEILALKAEVKSKLTLSPDEEASFKAREDDLKFKATEAFNERQTYGKGDKEKIVDVDKRLADYRAQLSALDKEKKALIASRKAQAKADTAARQAEKEKLAELKAKYAEEIKGEISEDQKAQNVVLAKEIYLSIGRYKFFRKIGLFVRMLFAFKKAFRLGLDLDDDTVRNGVFDNVAFRVRYIDETEEKIHGECILNLVKIKNPHDWQLIRGRKIATVFQDPMTSLNPIITIGKQISSIIMKHQKCSETEARARAIEMMKKVGIVNAENRYDDYPFQYSGGMRQRIVIAIALSCQPKILICDEPTTALDVTIQAQILRLIKDLQKEFGYTIVFITHDLGVVANIADRVAVLYAGQIVELGTVEDIFYDPKHPYTWALLSSLPQLAQKNTKLYSIAGTPPSLYNQIIGDPFAPRNPYCLKVDTLKEAPIFKVSDTHYAKTWLLDPRAPKIEKPETIQNIHEKLLATFNI